MRATSSHAPDAIAHVLVFDAGERFPDALERWLRERGIEGGSFTGLGALRRATLAFFDCDAKRYEEIPIEEQVEVGSLVGNVARSEDGELIVHAHCVLGRRDGSALAGHVKSATVRPTLELYFTETGGALRRAPDAASGLDLLRP